ncbi:helix-turn-helix domain-containing protein [Virgibacillus halodenitrificans]|uniref:helix-turn-helix transcriptional regulator n=1 Tax=Virgibacillus halodenitrificans TaxID=1482 RepID=UPI00136F9262|nr:helix-turn-helix domain-containing protein [Virgibacillus halodenitrificans]MYL44629.1 helix-turn-helix domain-containing protein [Virgibacillus halodenitrificans]
MNNKLREVRMDIGMSVSELARRSNTSRQTITNIELHGQEPSGLIMLAIAKSLNKDPREIFFTENVIQDLQKSGQEVV